MKAEVDALLDYRGGLEDYHRDDPWREPVVDHFRWNLDQMVTACREQGIPLVMIRPVSNLLDCPPMKFEDASNLSTDRLAQFHEHWERAKASAAMPAESLKELHAALAIDPHHAGASFLLGRLEFETSDYELAREHLTRARDDDVCPLRATTRLLDAFHEVTHARSVLAVDAEALFSGLSEHGIVGNQWLVDHVHPKIEGHQRLGEALAERIIGAGYFVATQNDWRSARRQLYREHLAGIGEEYYHRGRQRLEGLILWTQGRAKKLRAGE